MKDLWLENSMKTWSWLAKRISEEGSRLLLENVYEQHPHDREEELWPSLKYLESIWPW